MQRTVANGARSYIAPRLGPSRRLFGTATPPWQQGNPWLPSISCRAAHAHQHSHLEEAIMDMQQLQQRPDAPLPTHFPVRTQHIFRTASQLAPSSTVTTTTIKTPTLHQSFIPHLDGVKTDAVEVLEFLREELLMSQARTAAVVTAEESGAALLDLISVLVLLDEDVRLEEPGAVILFQPVLDMRNKIHSNANLRHHLHIHYTGHTANGHNGHSNSHHSHGKGHSSHSNGHSSRHSNGHNSSHDTSHALNAGDLAPAVPIAALVSKARCPKLLMGYPSTCIVATLRMDSADIAGVIADAVADHGSTRLRVANSAEGLVAAWRAIRRARAVVRARSSGAQDVVCTVQVESFVSTPAPTLNTSRPPSASGNISAIATASSPAHQPHQQGIMYFNIWRIR